MIEAIMIIFVSMVLLLMGLLLITGYVAVGYLVVLLVDHIRHRNATESEMRNHTRKG